MSNQSAGSDSRARIVGLPSSFQSSVDRNLRSLFDASRRGLFWAKGVVAFASMLILVGAVVAVAQAPTLQPAWNQLLPVTSPPATFNSALAYDPVHTQAVLFGGTLKSTDSGAVGNTWLWNGSNWSPASPSTSPSARSASAMAYDAIGGNIVLFGGVDSTGSVQADTWQWNGSNWSLVPPSSNPANNPPARFAANMVYDAALGEIVLFGGNSAVGNTDLNDTWVWNGSTATWTQITTSSSPSARDTFGMAYDSIRQQVVLFGGYSSASYPDDTWTFNGTNWTLQSPVTSPPAREPAGMAFDPALGETVMFGGINAGNLNDTWVWNGSTWTNVTSPGPKQRWNSVMTYDAAENQLLIFSGNGLQSLDDTWIYGLAQNFSNINVCQSGAPAPCSTTLALTYAISTATNFGTTTVVTQGATGLDFSLTGGGTCTGSVGADSSCTVNVTFTPLLPGLRMGAVELFDNSGHLLTTTPIYGVGQAPELAYGPPATGNGPSGLESVIPGLTNDLYSANGMTTDASGNLYITNYLPSHSSNVLKVALSNSSITTIGGFITPESVAIDGAGNLYVADNGLNSGNGEVLELAPSCANSSCGTVVYSQPSNGSPAGVAVDGSGDVFVADLKQGLFEIPAGCGNSACWVPVGSGWNQASAVAVDAAGDLFVGASGNHEVVEMPAGCTSNSCQIPIGSNWVSPSSVAVDPAGDVVVADYGLNGGLGGVVEIPAACMPSNCQTPLLNGEAIYSLGVTVNAIGEIFIADDQNLAIDQVNSSQPPTMAFQASAWGVESSDSPQSLSILNVGNQTLDIVGIATGSDWQQTDLNGNPPDCTNTSLVVPGNGCNISIDFIPQGGSGAEGLSSAVELHDNSLNGNYAQQDIITTGSTTGGGGNNYTLTVSGTGVGSGSVVSTTDSNISCTITNGSASGNCSYGYPSGGVVTLVANGNGSTFAGWGGACAGQGTGQCSLTLNGNESVTASFIPPNGTANVCSGGQSTDCSTSFPVSFNLGAPTSIGSVLVVTQGYTGLDFTEGTPDTCSGNTVAACTVNVTFTPQAVGMRLGAVELVNNGTIIATQPIYGVGQGPVAAFNPLTVFGQYLGGASGECGQPTFPTCTSLNEPQGVAIDVQGNVFMSDTGNGQIVELFQNRNTFNGSGTSYNGGGSGNGNNSVPVVTGLHSPEGLAVDGAGNLFIADANYYGVGLGGAVVEVAARGGAQTVVYPLSPNPSSSPVGVTVDGTGDLWVSDDGLGEVVETPAGCTDSSCQNVPYHPNVSGELIGGLAVDAFGDVFVPDATQHWVIEITAPGGSLSTVGSGWSTPTSVAVDAAGDVYVTDTGLNSVMEVPAGCGSNSCEFSIASGQSYGVAVDPMGVVQFVNYGNGPSNEGLNTVLQGFYGFGFAQTLVGNTSTDSPKYVNLQNVGNQTLTATALTFSDPNDFNQHEPAVGSGLPPGCTSTSSLAAGAACSLGVNFNPETGGQINGSVSITDNGLNNSTPTQTFTLGGTGVPGSGGNFLTVAETGSGTGSVASGDSLISCSLASGSTTGVCVAAYSGGTVMLTANPATGSAFTGWGGACSGSSLTCTVNMSASQNVTASFGPGGFGNVNVCTGGNPSGCPGSSQTVTFNFTASTTVNSVQAVTQGASGLDFQNSGDTCSGYTFSSGQSCTVTVAFFPTAPGLRLGAVQLLNSGVVVATQPVYGIGQGPAISFNPATQVTVNTGNTFLSAPDGVAVDAAGDVFISDNGNGQIVEVAANTNVSTITGVNSPQGLAVDGAGDLYVAEAGTPGEVVQFTPLCANISCQNVVYNPGGSSSPSDVAVDGVGDLFIADVGLHEVVEIPAGGGSQTVVYPSSPNSNSSPGGVAVDGAGNLYIADSGLKVVVELPANGGAQIPIGGGWSTPSSVAVDAAGDVYVVDVALAEAVEVPPTCTGANASYSCMDSLSNLQDFPAVALALDGAGDVFVAEQSPNQVLELQASQSATVSFGEVGEGYQSNYGSSQYDTPLFIQNIGNGSQPLTGSVGPISGAYFFEDSGGTTCSTSFTLASGATCVENFYFYPQNAVGTLNASAVATDNTLSANPATQTINLTGYSYGLLVTVNVTGTGSGSVSSAPTLVNCTIVAGVPTGGGCSASQRTGFTYSFFETPISGYMFTGWGGDCSNYGSNPICNLEITTSTTIIANFAPSTTNYTLTVADVGTGSGTVTDSSQITCTETNGTITGAACSGSYTSGTQVILTASVSGNSIFAGWGGDCASSGASPTCTLTVNSNLNPIASFVAQGDAQPDALMPITAGVVYGQNGSFTSPNGNLGGISANSLYQPDNLTVDANGNLYVADLQNSRVLYYPAGSTTATRVYGQNGSFTNGSANAVSADSLNNPYGVAVDSSGGLYIADWNNSRVLYYAAGSTTATRVYGQGGNFTTNTANNGGATANSLNGPQSVALDSSGNLYVADTGNSRVLFYPAGSTTATQVYGQGGSFTSDIGGVGAGGLSSPFALTLDGSGNLYVADSGNNRVLFYPAGSTTATQVYGQGGSFTSNAQNNGGVSANSLFSPQGVVVDRGGNLYVADYFNSRVLFYPSGSTTATRVYGQGGSLTSNNPQTDANSLNNPAAVALDNTGNLYVADKSNNRVVEYGPFGNVNVCPNGASTPAPCNNTITYSYYAAAPTTFGTPQVVTQGAANLDFTLGSGGACTGTVNAGNVCTVNVQFAPSAPGLRMGAIELYDNSTPANLLATAPTYGIGQGAAAAFGPGTQTTLPTVGLNSPSRLALDGAGDLFISDYGLGEVLKLTPGGVQTTVQTSGLNAGTNPPGGVAVDGAGDLFIAEEGNASVAEIPAGCTSVACQVTVPVTGLGSPYDVAVDGAGDLFIADEGKSTVVKFTPSGVQTTVPASGLHGPFGLAVDAAGDVFISDTYNNRVVEVTAAGVQTSLPATVTAPEGVWVDAAGDVFIADSIPNSRIVELPAGGGAQITVYQGNVPEGVVADGAGDLFIANTFASQVVEVNRSQAPSFAFGSINVGSSSSTQTVTLQNIGNQSLSAILPGFAVGAPNFYQISGSGTPPDCLYNFSLTPGATCDANIIFEPQIAGNPLTSTAVFTDNTLNGSPATQTVNLSGAGVAAAPPNYTLSMTDLGTGSGTVTSNSLASPAISCVETSGSVSGTCSENDPSGTLVILTEAAGGSSTFLGWGGVCASSGTSATCTVTMSQAQNVTAEFVQGDFGSVNVGSSGSLQVTFTPTTTINNATVQVVTQGIPGLDFTVGTGCTGTILANNSCTVNITFSPQAPGLRMGAVELSGSGGLVATQLIYGIGQAPEAAFGPTVSYTTPFSNMSTIFYSSQVTEPLNLAGPLTTDAAGNLYQVNSSTLQKLAPPYNGSATTVATGFANPHAGAIDGAGNLYVADSGLGANGEVVKLAPGCTSVSCASVVYAPASAVGVYGVAVDGSGDLFISDNSAGAFEIPAGCGNSSCYITLYNPGGGSIADSVAVDASGDLFVADSGLSQVVKIPAGGGAPVQVGTGWGLPMGVAVDAAGDVFVADFALTIGTQQNAGGVVEVPVGCTNNANNCQILLLTAGSPDPYVVTVSPLGQLFAATDGPSFEINLSQPPSLAFAATNVGVTSTDSPQSVTLQNIGNQHLRGSVSLTSGQNFAIGPSSTCSGTDMLPGESCSENFDFTPETAGNPLTTTAVFSDNALNGAPATQTVNLSGTGETVVPTDYALTVTELGSGSGTVTDNSQITCTETNGIITGSACSGSYAGAVTLSANAIGSSTFLGWGGACASSGTNSTCNLTVSAATNVTASFSQQNFGSINVCPSGSSTPSPCNSSQTVTFNLAATTNIGAIQVVTQGATGLDFSLGSGSTCSAATITQGNSCNVNVNFTPLAPGLRMGAVELFDTGGHLVASTPIYGVAQGPEVAFSQVTQTAVNTTSSPLNQAKGLVVDAAGDVFIADTGNHRVVEVAANGAMTTVGTGWMQPQGMAVDGAGNLYVADNTLNEVVEVPAGCTSSICQKILINEETTVNGATLPVRAELGVAVDGAGNVFLGDFVDGEVVEIPANGGTPTVVYNPAGANPVGLGVDGAGDLFVADHGLQQVVEVPPGCNNVGCRRVIGSGWQQPDSVAVDAAGDVYVADEGPAPSLVLGEVVEVLPPSCTGNCQIVLASGLNTVNATVDATGDVFISNQANNQVMELNRSQPPSLSFAVTNEGIASADSPQAVSVQNVGNQPLTGSVTGTSTANFAENLGSTCTTFTLAAGAICSEGFSFKPQNTGLLNDTAIFSDNTMNLASSVVVQTVNLSGIGSVNGQTGTAVPNVVGMTEAAAATILTESGLTLGTVSSQYSSSEPQGSVVGESPAAGAQVNLGSPIALLISTGQAPPPAPNPLTFENNYFVTGDFATAGTNLRGTGSVNVASGTINIPDSTSGGTQGVPEGADIVDGFLYWETLENTAVPSGNTGTFLGYPITGQQIGNDLPYTDSGLAGTLRVYRADVNAYFQVSAAWNGARVGSGSFAITLPDSGKTGQFPLNEGASLVVIYRALSTAVPLKSVVIYDGSALLNASNTQNVQGFYDAVGGATPGEVATLYSAGGNWNSLPSPVTTLTAHASQYTVNLNSGYAYAAVIFSTPVTNSDNDGILDAWKSGPSSPADFFAGQPGYYDVKTQSWVALPGAQHGKKDLFVQLDWMCGAVDPTTGDCSGEDLFPSPDPDGNDPLVMVKQAFAQSGIALHLEVGNAVPESICNDNAGQLCQFPGEPGVIGWKNSLEFSKLWPRNFTSCSEGGDCTVRFPYGQKDSYHYVLFGHSLAIPAWNTRFGSLTAISTNPSAGQTTITTTNRGASTSINYCPSRFTISGALSNPGLNGVYNTVSCPDGQTIILSTPGVTAWSYLSGTPNEPDIGLTSGTVTSISGYSDLGGADSAVTLALWETAPKQDMSKRANVIAGTLFHELGHTLGLTHGGLYYQGGTGSYVPTFDVNCKPNYQSSMNYLFQLGGVGPSSAVAYSNQTLETLTESSIGGISNLDDISSVPAAFSTSAWYSPTEPPNSTESPAQLHCDGSPLNPGETGYFVQGSVLPVTPPWSSNQNITFDGVQPGSTGLPGLVGYNDVSNIDLRQVGATGGEYASLASVLNFGSSSAPLNITPGGSVTVGAGGTATVGKNGTVTLNNGGNVTVGSGAVINSGGLITFGTGSNVTFSADASNNTITPGKSGMVTLPIGGSITLNNGGGTITMGGGGTVTMGGGGTITMGGGGSITLPLGGTITIPAAGGEFAVPPGGTVNLNNGSSVTVGGSTSVTVGGSGTVTMGGGGTITMGGGGTVTMGGGGTVTMGGGGTVTMGGGGTITMGGGGTVTMGGGGTVTMGGGGTITMGGGGTVTMGGGGDVSVGSGGSVTLGNGGAVTLSSGGSIAVNSSGGTITMGGGGTVTENSGGGTITMGGGGTITMGGGGTITMGGGGTITGPGIGTVTVPSTGGNYNVPAGGTVTLDAAGGTVTMGGGGTITMGGGGTITMGGGGTITMGGGGTVTMGGGGTITMGGGGVVALGGAGSNVTLGGGGNFSLGGGGTITMGGGGTTTNEMDYETANSVVRPPPAATYSNPSGNSVQVNWTAPAFGVVQTYTISRSVINPPNTPPSTPEVIGSVSGVNGYAPATTFTDTTPPSGTLIYTIATTLVPDTVGSTPRSSAPSPPAVLTVGQTIVLGPLPSSVPLSSSTPSTLTITATSESNSSGSGLSPNMQLVSFSTSGPCSVGTSTIDNSGDANNGVSSATVTLNSTGSCTITASQAGNSTTVAPPTTAYSSATPVSGSFMILPQGSTTQSQTITFGTLPSAQYGGNPFTVSATSTSGLTVIFSAPANGPCSVSGTTVTITGAGLCKITAAAPAGQNNNYTYSSASLTQSLNILTAPLTVTATNLSSVYGQPLPSLTPSLNVNYTLTGFVGLDTASAINGQPALSTTLTSSSSVGTYLNAITVSTGTLAAANYSFIYANGSLTITQASPTISVGSSGSPSNYGSPVTFTATVTAGDTNLVTFYSGATVLGTATPSNGAAMLTTSSLAPGSYTITASIAAGGNYTNASTTSGITQTVNQSSSSITTNPTASAITYGQALSASTLNGGAGSPAGGTFSWTAPTTIPLAGTPTESITYTPTNTSEYGTATGSISVTVNKATPTATLGSSLNPSTYGTSVTFTSSLAAVGGGVLPTGTVTFKNGATTLCNAVSLSGGSATCATTALAVPSDSIIAVYSGDSNYNTATSSTLTQTVNQASSSITTNPTATAITYGQALSASTLGGGVGSPTGGAFSWTSPMTIPLAGTPTESITYTPSNTTDYGTATGSISVTVNKASQTILFTTYPSSAADGTSFTVAATGGASGNPVTFTASGVCSVPLGSATYTMTAGTGTCSVIANQAGNSNYLAAPQVIETVTATSGPVITVSPSSINFGPVAVGSITTKTVTVSNTGNAAATISTPRISLLGASNSNEFVMVNLCPSSLAAGKSCTITVSFVAGAYYSTPQTATLQVMDNAPTSPQPVGLSATILDPQTITFTSVPSTAVYNTSFTVTATGGGSGNPVTFTASGACSVPSGSATYTMTSGTGTCSVIANQAGNSTTYAPAAQVTKTVTATLATQTIALTNPPTSAGYKTSFTATASASSGLAVTFTSSGACSNSGATYTMTGATGTCSVIANQAGNSDYSAAPQVTKSVTATKAAQTISLTNPPASAAYKSSFTATASATSGLAVTFTSSGACSNSGATYTMTSSTGTCSVIVNQAGNSNYTAAPTVTKTVTATQATQTITFTTNPPATAAYKTSFTVAATGGASGNAVTFTSSGSCSNSGATYTMTSGTGTCSVIANQAANSNYTAAPTVTKTVTATYSTATLTPSSLNFGTVTSGHSSAAQTATLKNTGTTPLIISSIALTGANSSNYTESNTCPSSSSSLAAGASCTISVTFKSGGKSAPETLTVTDNTASPGTQSVSLTGN